MKVQIRLTILTNGKEALVDNKLAVAWFALLWALFLGLIVRPLSVVLVWILPPVLTVGAELVFKAVVSLIHHFAH